MNDIIMNGIKISRIDPLHLIMDRFDNHFIISFHLNIGSGYLFSITDENCLALHFGMDTSIMLDKDNKGKLKITGVDLIYE